MGGKKLPLRWTGVNADVLPESCGPHSSEVVAWLWKSREVRGSCSSDITEEGFPSAGLDAKAQGTPSRAAINLPLLI